MKPKISATGNIKLPALTIAEPSVGDGYLIVARDLARAFEVTVKIDNVPQRATVIIGAFALECSLKAFLWHKGQNEVRNVGHNLLCLWIMAYKEGLDIQKNFPNWLEILADGFWPNQFFRYQQAKNESGKSFTPNGGQFPPLSLMAIDLRNLMEKIESAIRR